jgi:hypothetical protein
MNAQRQLLRVISLRSDKANDVSFENALRNIGHKVVVLSSLEPAFSLVDSSWPDIVAFDPCSQFSTAGSVKRLRTCFEGVIVATGEIPDPTVVEMLQDLGTEYFASNASEFLEAADSVPIRPHGERPYDLEPPPTSVGGSEPRQLLLAEPVDVDPINAVPRPNLKIFTR